MSHPTPWEPKDPSEQRVSHEEREQVAEVLRIAAGDGRLTLEELDERLEACFSARTYADLSRLVADLPGQALAGQRLQPPAQVRPKDVVRVKRAGGHLRYEGAWVVPRRLEAEVYGGNVLLDFTSATVAEPVTEVDLRLQGGNLRLVLPDGYAVDADEVEILGGSVVRRRAADLPADTPVVHRIVVTGQLVGGNVVVLPSRPARRPGRLRRMLGRR
ncbi:DUF1707 SHOCT-like domain-containing protein [Allostreptomyces psammosilenae]|uniref:DUF1707 domain-containing protein n=1 Tax=Allostreptomyces psammosilenae TaxID=1892865 RepID=A0A852ZXU7_9ACTN|nr:DUF1707 domain-containing protein [Allostreptomyces psammosilenae]NYI07166.1 hypothetical protein [Allostreptomyces psammosilenae]